MWLVNLTLAHALIYYRIRGRIISVFQCCVNFGILVAFWIQYGTSHIQSEASWRIPMGLQMIVRNAAERANAGSWTG